jgi:RNA 2',3'-cyclic 3'-phosphodiesterase
MTLTARERLFLALWPPPATRADLERLSLAVGPIDGRSVPARNWHVTLVFLGSVDHTRRLCIQQAMTSIVASPFELVFDCVQRRRGMVWLTARTLPPALLALVQSLNRALAGCGHSAPSPGFRVHVTLARDVTRFRPPPAVAPIRWPASEFCLAMSRPAPGGSEYTVQQCWPLGRAASDGVGDNPAG